MDWIDRWKISENLRRSRLAPFTVVLLLLSWLLLPESAFIGTPFALLSVLIPLVSIANAARLHPPGEPWASYFWSVGETMALNAARALLLVALLPSDAFPSLNAIMRVVGRRLITHRHLLQWTRFDTVQSNQVREHANYWTRMWPAPALALVSFALVSGRSLSAFIVALPLLALWLVSPSLAAFTSQPLPTAENPLSSEARRDLRIVARRIWHFFDTFVAEPDQRLPPDNYDAGADRIAHRTSPTNIGFALLSTLAAMDLGYLAHGAVIERWEKTLDTLESDQVRTLYDHCVRAIDHALRFGEHGLPLMGNGDWNDGMNRVGSEGKGESVWVGWFLFTNLLSFADLA